MTYRTPIPGYARARVLNPWVFANYGQPQRLRGYVSPRVFQSHSSQPRSAYLGTVETDTAVTEAVGETTKIMRRMQTLAYISTALAAVGILLAFKRSK